MGTGGISFRATASLFGALCAVLATGCRSNVEVDDLLSQLEVKGLARPSLARGHRFGRWLEVDLDCSARPSLEKACLIEQTSDPELAIEFLGDELEDTRDCAGLFEARGALYLSTGFPRAAVGDFLRAVALKPDSPEGWFALGHSYEVLDLSRQALEALEHARELGGQDFGLFLSLARVYRSLGRVGLAARHYEQALDLQGGPLAESQLAEIEVEIAVLATEDAGRAARVQTARERLESCRGDPLSDDGWLLRAIVSELSGQSPDTVSATLRALEVSPREFESLARSLITALQLTDPETNEGVRSELLAAETDTQRRAALERSLGRP